jgi:hypothetical protein
LSRSDFLVDAEENKEHLESALVGLADDLVGGNDGTFRLLQFFAANLDQSPEYHFPNNTKAPMPEQ